MGAYGNPAADEPHAAKACSIAQFVLNFRLSGGNLEKTLAIRGTAWYSIQATKGGPLPHTRHFGGVP